MGECHGAFFAVRGRNLDGHHREGGVHVRQVAGIVLEGHVSSPGIVSTYCSPGRYKDDRNETSNLATKALSDVKTEQTE